MNEPITDVLNLDLSAPREQRSTVHLPTSQEIFNAEIAAFFSSFDKNRIVSASDAMRLTAVSAAVTFISDQIAALPVHTYKDNDNGPERTSSKLNDLLTGYVNSDCETFYQLRKTMAFNYLLHGRALAHIERDGLDRPAGLRALPATVKPQRIRGQKVYTETFATGRVRHYKPSEIIDFVQIPSVDGLGHYSPLETHRERLNQMLAVEQYAAKVFSKGGVPPLQLRTDTAYTTPAQATAAAEAVSSAVKAAANSDGQILALPPAYWLEKIGLDPQTMQLADVRKFNLLEVSRIFNLPPQFLQDLSFGTYSNTEQQSHNLVKFLLQPMVANFERELSLKLASDDEYIKFNFGSLQRGDFSSQITALAKAVFSGIMTPNEARELLEYSKIEGGEELFMQGANQTIQNLIESNNNEQK